MGCMLDQSSTLLHLSSGFGLPLDRPNGALYQPNTQGIGQTHHNTTGQIAQDTGVTEWQKGLQLRVVRLS